MTAQEKLDQFRFDNDREPNFEELMYITEVTPEDHYYRWMKMAYSAPVVNLIYEDSSFLTRVGNPKMKRSLTKRAKEAIMSLWSRLRLYF